MTGQSIPEGQRPLTKANRRELEFLRQLWVTGQRVYTVVEMDPSSRERCFQRLVDRKLIRMITNQRQITLFAGEVDEQTWLYAEYEIRLTRKGLKEAKEGNLDGQAATPVRRGGRSGERGRRDRRGRRRNAGDVPAVSRQIA
jgi:hypothetical protein